MASGENDINCVFCKKPIKAEIKFCPHCGKKQPQPDSNTYNLDPYKILQVSPDAEKEVIDAAYKSLARKYHPDTNKTDFATKKMQEINWAFGILKDEKTRERWDQTKGNPEKVTAKRSEEKQKKEDTPKTNQETPKIENKGKQTDDDKREEKVRHEEYEKEEVIKKKEETYKNKNQPNFLLAFVIFSTICLFIYLISQYSTPEISNVPPTQVISQPKEVITTAPQKPTITPRPVSGDVIVHEDFSKDFNRRYSSDNSIFVEGSNGKYVIGIQPKSTDNYSWSYGYTDWGLDDYQDEIQYEFDIELRNRETHIITEKDLGLTAIPIEYGFYIGNIPKNTFLSISLIEYDGKIVGWNIGDNNSLYVRKPKNKMNLQFETCWADFNSYFNESGLQASRGSLVYQNSIKANCGFQFLDNEKVIFNKRVIKPFHVKIIRNSLNVKFYLEEILLQEVDIPEEFYIYNNQTEKYDSINLIKTELKSFGFVLYDYGKEFEIEIDNFEAKIP